MLFTERYAPKRYEDIIGNAEAISAAKKWAESWAKGERQKPLLLFGPPGCGKTALAHVIAFENGWEVIEVNASDERERIKLRELLIPATSTSTLDGKRRVIILDEVEEIDAKDIADICERSQQPIILIANDPFGKKIRPIKEQAISIKLNRVNKSALSQFIAKIARENAIKIDKKSILQIASEGDVRSALLDLQIGSVSYRDREKSIFQAIRRIFRSQNFEDARAAIKGIDVDLQMLLAWLSEILKNEYKNKTPLELWRACSALARADLFETAARKKQAWKLEKYAYDLATAGVALAKQTPFTHYSPLPILQKDKGSDEKNMRKILKSAAEKIAKSMHTSSRKILRDLPIIAMFIDFSKYNFDTSELEVLKGLRRL